MDNNLDLTKIERKTVASQFQDGILDINLGMLILGSAFAPLIEKMGVAHPFSWAILATPALIFFAAAKKFISQPRIGKVVLGMPRQSGRAITFRLILFIFLGYIIFTKMVENGTIPRMIIHQHDYTIALAGSGLLVIFGIVQYLFMGFSRLVTYAFILAVSMISKEYLVAQAVLNGEFYLEIITGLVISAIGAKQLISFIHQYPITQKER